ncbi:MAG TPA: polysaccharide biosynthesis/export family protein [Xanthobacteraceae bacterium]|jgi:polysaccharide export outer membrane protein
MRLRRAITFSLLALALVGCVRRPPAPIAAVPIAPPVVAAPVVTAPAAALAYAPEAPGPYRLGAGDRLRVVVFGQEGLTNAYTVDDSGGITLPLIGRVVARGMTTSELSQAVASRLKQGFIREPHVAVEVELHRPFFILGEVANPGQYPYVANMTAETAVAIAGGFTPRAERWRVQVSRSIDGGVARAKVPLAYPVEPGDTINIAERWF